MHKINRLALIVVLTIILIQSGCDKEPNSLGLEIQPESDKINVQFSDTTGIITFSLPEDSVRTDETTENILGRYYDPVFGTSSSSIYTQIHLSTSSMDFGIDPQLDSIILSLEYTGSYYGDTTIPMNFIVYELDDIIYRDSVYYSNQTIALGTQIAEASIAPSPTDSIYIDTTKYKAQLRIFLNEYFGNKILTASEDDLSSNEKFLEFIKGIYITTDSINPGGALLLFDILATNSQVSLYYSNSDSDSLEYSFVINENNARFMNFNHYNFENADPDFKAQVVNGDTSLGQEKIYLQSMAGVKTKIRFPNIKNWIKNGNIAVNEAKLILTNFDKESEFSPPPELTLLIINEDGSVSFIPDQFEGTIYFGGIYDESSGEYYFRISRYIQNVLKEDTEDFGLYLVVQGASLITNRVILNGAEPLQSEYKVKLNLTYTKLD